MPTFASDMVATCNVLGLFGARSTFPCFICETASENFHDYQAPCIQRSKETQDEVIKNGGLHPTKLFKDKKSGKMIKVHWGYAHASLLDEYIPYEKVIIELLHLWLRITGRLLQNLTRDIVQFHNVTLEKLDRSKHSCYNSYFAYLHDVCKLKSLQPNPRKERGTESLHNDLTGGDAERFYSKLLILKSIFDCFENGSSKYKLFTLFYKIYMKIRHNGYKCSADLKKDTSKWMDLYLECYHFNTITPYIHIFVVHLHEQMERFGNIRNYSTQGKFDAFSNKMIE